MKNIICLFVVVTLFYSCGNEIDNLEEEIDPTLIYEKNNPTCQYQGPNLVIPGTIHTYTLFDVNGHNISWSAPSNTTVLQENRNPNSFSLTLKFNSNFTGGYFNAGDVVNNTCSVFFYINADICGLNLSNVGELNGNQQNEVAFFTIPTLDSGWSITSSSFSVTYQSNNVSNFIGYQNPNGYPQILIPVYCTDRVKKVTASVTASSGSDSCTRTVSTNFSPPVCGSGGGIGIGGF
ncbi:hypothetical protein [Aquimarina sp. AU58]|uniref:hypothetical protein n=1 Tax=Aquimarina sp. AU58 TaxID=1874112 RepID=UPI000D6528C8|nr:hypothetical protein [Aquimarina sp. AU58]